MKGTYNIVLKDGELPEKTVVSKQNWYKIEEYVTNLPHPVKHALESGARIEISRYNRPIVW